MVPYCELWAIYAYTSLHFGFEGRMLDLIALAPRRCISSLTVREAKTLCDIFFTFSFYCDCTRLYVSAY